MGEKSQKILIKDAFLRLMINNVLLALATCVCGMIDNLFVGRVIGKDGLAAVGFFSPVAVATGLSYVIILGTQVLTSILVGSGKPKQVNRLFLSSFTVLAVIFFNFSVWSFVFRDGLASFLGANGEIHTLLSDYIKGYAPGIVFQTLSSMLMSLCPFNNDLKRSYCSIGAMIAGNVVGDWLLIDSFGLAGIGISSTIGSLASFLILLPGFLKKDKLFCLSLKDGFDFKLVLKAASRGLPSLMLTLGVIIKNACFNYSLNNFVGASGVAVAGIMATVSALTGAVPAGCYNAYSALAGIYFGEEDRESLLDLTRIALRIGVFSCTAATVLIMLFSNPLSEFFVPQDESVQELTAHMFVLAFTYLVPNVIFNIFLQAYRAQNRMLLVNIMCFFETTVIGLFTLFAVEPLGADAAWLSNTVIDVLCVGIVLISVVAYRKKLDFSLPALLKLPDNFGAGEGEYMTFSVAALDDAVHASERTIRFCTEHHYPERTAVFVGLCIEEMASNVRKHGFRNAKHSSCDIRIVIKDDRLTVRIRDNCREFDPRKRIKLLDPAHPEKNIGIRIVSKLAYRIEYYNNAGINTTIMKF